MEFDGQEPDIICAMGASGFGTQDDSTIKMVGKVLFVLAQVKIACKLQKGVFSLSSEQELDSSSISLQEDMDTCVD